MSRRRMFGLFVVLGAVAVALSSAGTARALVSTGGGPWYWQNPLPQGNRLFDVVFVDARNGWAVGQSGAIIHTSDGGETWTGQDSGTTWNLTRVSFSDTLNGWAIGRSELEQQDLLWTKVLLHTTDGGQTWRRERLPGGQWPYTLADVCFIDAEHGWLLVTTDYSAYLLRTRDGGATWEFQAPETFANLGGITFTDRQHGWAVGRWNVFTTADGGATWTIAYHDTDMTHGFTTVTVLGDSGWVTGHDNTYAPILLTSTDGGKSWAPVESPPDLVCAPSFVSATEGWGISSILTQGIVHTTDGGVTWHSQYTPLYSDAYDFKQLLAQSIAAADGQHAWTVGAGGALLRTTDGGTWAPVSSSAAAGSLSAVDFSDSTHGWAVGWSGPGGLILHTSDGGLTWGSQDSGTLHGLTSISFVDDMDGWVGIGDGDPSGRSLLHTTDGGATWDFVSNGQWFDGGGVSKVQFVDEDHGWEMVNYSGLMARTTDGGASWQELDTGGMTGAFDFAFADANHGWLVGQASVDITGAPIGKTAYTTDGGLTWTPDGLGHVDGEDYMAHLAVADLKHGFACGGHTIWRMTDGVHWQALELSAQVPALPAEATTARFTAVVAIDTDSAVVVARNGIVLRTDNGGATWFEQKSGLARQDLGPYDAPLLDGVTAVDPTHLWAVGGRGVILSTWSGASGVDTTPPVTSLPEGDGSWWPRAVFHLLAADDLSGVASTRYRVDGGAWLPGADVRLAPGSHALAFSSTDLAGNVEIAVSRTVKVDLTPPVTTATGADGTLWYDHDIDVTFTASDALSGVATTRWTVFGGLPQTASSIHVAAPPDSSNDGPHNIWYWSEDAAGNAESAQNLWVNIDTWSPTTTTEGDGTVVTDTTDIGMTAVDDPAQPNITTSGVETTFYSIDGGPELAAAPAAAGGASSMASSVLGEASPPTCYAVIDPVAQNLSDGAHTVSYHSVDAAGNAEAPKSISIVVQAGALTALQTVGHTATNQPTAAWLLPSGWAPTLIEVSSKATTAVGGGFAATVARGALTATSTKWTGAGAPLHPGTYYVHVRFHNAVAGTDQWTAVKSLTVPKTNAPVLLKPLGLSVKKIVVGGRRQLRATCTVRTRDDSLGRLLVRIVQQRVVGGRVLAAVTRDTSVGAPLSLGSRDHTYRLVWTRPAKLAGKGVFRLTVRVRDQEYNWSGALKVSATTAF